MSAFLTFLMTITPAKADVFVEEICVSMDEDFDDTWEEADYWNTHHNARPLRGVRVVVTDHTGMNTLFDDYAIEQGADIGCIEVKLDDTETYDVTVYAEAMVRGYHIVVDNYYAGYTVHERFLNDFSPRHGGIDIHIPWGQPGFVEVLASQFMFARLGVGGAGSWPGNEVYYLINPPAVQGAPTAYAMIQPRPPANGYPYSPAHIKATSFPYDEASKFVITHETGHWIQGMNDEQLTPFFDMSASLMGCDGATWSDPTSHQLFQREYQSAAASEGFASFFSAVTFNRANESDCVIQIQRDGASRGYNIDLFLPPGGGVDPEETKYLNNQLSCEGKPWDINHNGVRDGAEPYVLGYVTARDWLDDVHGHSTCSGTATTSRLGNEYDWIRYFWDMRTDENLSTADLVKLMDDANPHDWADVSGNSSDIVYQRLTGAAAINGWTTKHNNQKSNGQDR